MTTRTPTSPGDPASGVTQAPPNNLAAEQEERLDRALAQGRQALDAGQYGEAIEAFSAVIQERPADFNARLQRGRAHFWSGQHAPACADFQEAWRLKEEHDRTAQCYLVIATIDNEDENSILGVFPDSPEGLSRAMKLAADVAYDSVVRDRLIEEGDLIYSTLVKRCDGLDCKHIRTHIVQQ